MTLLERIKTLCLESSTSLASLEKTLTFGNGTLSRWDTSSPSIDKIQKVADHFNVSIDYLVGQGERCPQEGSSQGDTPADQPRDFYAQFETIAETLGYKVHLNNDSPSFIEYRGKKNQLETQKVVNLMDNVQSFIKFSLQEAFKNADEEYGEDFPTIVVAARGGRYKLDKKAAQKLAQSAAKAPNRAHDNDLF